VTLTSLDGRTASLSVALGARGKVRISLDELLATWGETVPELLGRADQLSELAGALEALASAGDVVLPAPRSWDRTTRPPLPLFVTVPAARTRRRDTAWKRFPWRHDLAFVASLPTLTPNQFEMLKRLNDWLGTGARHGEVVSTRLRSAEIFDQEKYIDELVRSPALFGPGRITYELLATRRLAPPMYVERVGAGDELLVVENADPFWAVVEVLRVLDSPIGRVGCGWGRCAEASIGGAERGGRPSVIWYWGDFDPEGIDIAEGVAATAERFGLPPVRPAVALWLEMAGLEGQDPGRYRWDKVDSGWLGTEAWTALAPVRLARGRVAQEKVGLPALRRVLGADRPDGPEHSARAG
jgi:hypothetical protein